MRPLTTPGVPTDQSWHVGRDFGVRGAAALGTGECVSVTYWGSGRVRWIRLRFRDGTEKSYAPSHLREVGR